MVKMKKDQKNNKVIISETTRVFPGDYIRFIKQMDPNVMEIEKVEKCHDINPHM
jgi:hypothetical protein